jgi:hypothetical protein
MPDTINPTRLTNKPAKPDGEHFGDQFAQTFLGQDDAQVHQGGHVDPVAQAEAHQDYILEEASTFGNNFVQWIAAHKTVPIHVRAWGFVLGIFCIRAEYPAGAIEFDRIVAQAGEDLDLPGKSHANDDPLPPWTEITMRQATNFAELTSGYVALHRRQTDVHDDQAAYGIGRAWHNLRTTFPFGGPEAFDTVAAHAVRYYEHEKGKK